MSIEEFWNRWYNANELARVDIVKELLKARYKTMNENELHAKATLLNSYFVDLCDYLKKNREINLME